MNREALVLELARSYAAAATDESWATMTAPAEHKQTGEEEIPIRQEADGSKPGS